MACSLGLNVFLSSNTYMHTRLGAITTVIPVREHKTVDRSGLSRGLTCMEWAQCNVIAAIVWRKITMVDGW